MKLDRYDLSILKILSEQGRMTKSELARQVCLSASPTWERLKRLEDQGLIRGYQADVAWDRIFGGCTVIVEVSLDRHTAHDMQRFEQHVTEVPGIVQCHATGGGVDYILHVRARDIDHYQCLIDQLLEAQIGIDRYVTYIVTKTIKTRPAVPAEVHDLP
ncbi:Lrp/AsnC family transcriptional regulator [Castellaniella sp.]|uniref:Lrp/AsnC family transcriptional regulator n=1 Tax=Castellaniella sp. TaxID=1955812 RepID=UPI0035659ED5